MKGGVYRILTHKETPSYQKDSKKPFSLTVPFTEKEQPEETCRQNRANGGEKPGFFSSIALIGSEKSRAFPKKK